MGSRREPAVQQAQQHSRSHMAGGCREKGRSREKEVEEKKKKKHEAGSKAQDSQRSTDAMHECKPEGWPGTLHTVHGTQHSVNQGAASGPLSNTACTGDSAVRHRPSKCAFRVGFWPHAHQRSLGMLAAARAPLLQPAQAAAPAAPAAPAQACTRPARLDGLWGEASLHPLLSPALPRLHICFWSALPSLSPRLPRRPRLREATPRPRPALWQARPTFPSRRPRLPSLPLLVESATHLHPPFTCSYALSSPPNRHHTATNTRPLPPHCSPTLEHSPLRNSIGSRPASRSRSRSRTLTLTRTHKHPSPFALLLAPGTGNLIHSRPSHSLPAPARPTTNRRSLPFHTVTTLPSVQIRTSPLLRCVFLSALLHMAQPCHPLLLCSQA